MRLCKTTVAQPMSGRGPRPSRASLRRVMTGAVIGAAVATGVLLVLALTSKPLAPAEIARADAHQILVTSWPQPRCAGRCAATVLGPTSAGEWRVRLTSPRWVRCYHVTLKRFSWTLQHGLTGAIQVVCTTAEEAPPPAR
jgi:hypothetical protein